MVNEREPPRVVPMPTAPQQQQQQQRQNSPQQPEFGKPSPLRNPSKDKYNHLFNIPKPGQSRPEHHRPNQPSTQFVDPRNPRPQSSHSDASLVEIPKPPNFAPVRVGPPQPQYFSSNPNTVQQGWRPINTLHNQSARQFVDLTKKDNADEFDPDAALREPTAFGAPDPFSYVDSAQAQENLKALLEGAFDDEDDKPKTRRRKKQQEQKAADDLTSKLKGLDVSNKENQPEGQGEVEEEEEEEEDDGTVEGLKVKLLPHQIDGVAWMTEKEVGLRKKNGVLPKGGILADDMGLGKTIQAVALMLGNPRPPKDKDEKDKKKKIPSSVGKSTLVVAPLALIKQWESEVNTKVDKSKNMRVLVHHGTSRTKRSADLEKYDVVITTYQVLSSEHAGSSPTDEGPKVGCFGVHWYRIILDEAHTIKNRNAKMTKACYVLKSHYRWCLTGTPMQNNLDELQSLIQFLRIKPYDNISNWKDAITGPMKAGRGGIAMKRVQFFLRAFMKRRTKDVLKKDGALTSGKGAGKGETETFKIVGRNVELITAEFTAKERQFYDRLQTKAQASLDEMISGFEKNQYIGALVLLLRLRQACNHPELVKSSFNKDKDALSTGATNNKSKTNGSNDMDDIANMLGGLSVTSKQCDVCQMSLSAEESQAGALRCSECEASLKAQKKSSKKSGRKSKKSQKSKKTHTSKSRPSDTGKLRAARARRVVDSDDDDEGDWIVPSQNRETSDLGVAGDTDDENAEGGGDWIGSDDETGDEDESDGSDESTASESEEEDADEDTSDDEIQRVPFGASTKIRHLLGILEKETPDHKVIVFSQFTSMLDLVEPFLKDRGFKYCRYDGGMRNDLREASLHSLRNDKRTRVLLCSLKCGSLGLNLTAASRVVILEPFWNPFVEEQAIDRVHRINQTVDVTVYRLTIADTVEERILDLQEAKRKLAKAAIEGGKAIGKLSMADIMRLFRREAEHEGQHSHGNENVPTGPTRVLDQPKSYNVPPASFWQQSGPGANNYNYGQPVQPKPYVVPRSEQQQQHYQMPGAFGTGAYLPRSAVGPNMTQPGPSTSGSAGKTMRQEDPVWGRR